jgi:sigma-B regulation protein RsbU (phosphoserine phosphatase)
VDRPLLVWVELWRPFVESAALADTGPDPEAFIYANLTTSPRVLTHHLVSRSVEVDALALAILAVTAFLFFDLYVIAALLALVMISGLSRAVNRLTDATLKVQEGDFTARIEVQRRDQIGALQNSFNTMAANLQVLVDEAAQKEILEKDLSIAQELQHSLLPNTLEAPANLRFATHFAPSAAIGGDYYDLLRMPDGRLAVVIADVAGHGISAGLRMAMVKSALQVLSEREERPEEILRELHRFLAGVRRSQRTFVTLSLAVIEPATGEFSLVNAGHLPTYLLRGGEVREILLPSPPLGTLTPTCPKAHLELEPGDALVWLSDGLVEAVNVRAEVFGFDRVEAALAGPVENNPAAVRDRLLRAVRQHTGEFPLEDDRTVVVMVYLGPG